LRLSFFGLGYVGTVYAIGFSSMGFKVIGYDIDRERVRLLGLGKSPFHEPYLVEALESSIRSGCLEVTSDWRRAISDSAITFITVGTPSKKDGSINLQYVVSASKAIGKALRDKPKRSHVVVVKSTVIPGTTMGIVKATLERESGLRAFDDFGLAMNPEFLKEGSALEDFRQPDRILIGANDRRTMDRLCKVYASFKSPKILTNIPAAELIKYANNAFLAMKVSYINMIANLCQKTPGVDVKAVAEAIGIDKRVGSQFLKAGAGWGGSCWPKDLAALKSYGRSLGVELPLISATMEVNISQPNKVITLVEELIGDINGKRIAILGLAFKPNTDDIREAVSIRIIQELIRKGAKLAVYDPAAMSNMKRFMGEITIDYPDSAKECLRNADCAVIVTEWEEFKKIAPEDFQQLMRNPSLVDGRRIYDPGKYESKLKFRAIGLGT
jgi:UDPglucose 6-dehydrogenase